MGSMVRVNRGGSCGCRAGQMARGRARIWMVLLGWLYVMILSWPASASDDNERVRSILDVMESSYARIDDYVAVFRKQERVEGVLLPEETILFKFKKPHMVYMKWIANPHKGTEALYVEGKHDNKVIAHRGGILGFLTLSLDPRGPVAMQGNRHPITEAGFGFLIREMHRNIATALKHGDLRIDRLAEEVFYARPAVVVDAVFTPRSGRRYYAAHAVCHIDKELMLPVGAAFYDERDALFERYSFTDVKLNVGLPDGDFSKDNKEYRF